MSRLNSEDDARDLSITLTDKILNNFEAELKYFKQVWFNTSSTI